jgi:uncharacterized protein (TIGR02996 family)
VTDEESLLDEIEASPDDDAPRLVLADLMTARGDPRGELISVQCRLARGHDPAVASLERELLARHGARWAEPVAWAQDWTWQRGFIGVVTIGRVEDYLEHAGRFETLRPLPQLVIARSVPEPVVFSPRRDRLVVRTVTDQSRRSQGELQLDYLLDVWDVGARRRVVTVTRELTRRGGRFQGMAVEKVAFSEDGDGHELLLSGTDGSAKVSQRAPLPR